jgi:hypothetical protein
MFPKSLQPFSTQDFVLDGQTIQTPKCEVHFNKWEGQPVQETFGGKAIVSMDDQPMFAELAIVKHFVKEGWQARWIETYGKSKKAPIHLMEWKDDKYINQVHVPIEDQNILNLLKSISLRNGDSFAGCWDVLAWKNERIVFAESKRVKKDQIRSTQIDWLKASIKCGLDTNNFLVVEWDFI